MNNKDRHAGAPNLHSLHSMQVIAQHLRLSGDFDFDSIAANTPGFAGADLQALTKEAAAIAVSRIFKSLKESRAASAAGLAEVRCLLRCQNMLMSPKKLYSISVTGLALVIEIDHSRRSSNPQLDSDSSEPAGPSTLQHEQPIPFPPFSVFPIAFPGLHTMLYASASWQKHRDSDSACACLTYGCPLFVVVSKQIQTLSCGCMESFILTRRS